LSAARQLGCTGFVVTGGRSRRMGRDKALLEWEGGTLLDAAVSRLARVSDEVVLLTGQGDRYPERAERRVADAFEDGGALAGVDAGLHAHARSLGLFLAVDLPCVGVELLRHLVDAAREADAVVPVSPRGPEPLCAVYGARCREPIRRRLEAGERRMTCFWPDVRVREVGPDELARFGDPEALFRNLNTAADYSAARGRNAPPAR
jgi:molybdopterin-guanine dinucleotide biosynthesis protein A